MTNALNTGVLPYFFSISSAAKTLKIRREAVRGAVKSGALKTRRLPSHVREKITLPDLEQWIANLEQANVRQPHDSTSLLKKGE